MATEDNTALRQRFELLKGAEHHKNTLIEVWATFEPPQFFWYLTLRRNSYVVWINLLKTIIKNG